MDITRPAPVRRGVLPPVPPPPPPPPLSPAAQSHRSHPTGLRRFLSALGPGIITGASDDDPSGIGTYSVAGAQFGYQLLWLALLTYPLSAAVQEVCARIGLVTGHGLAAAAKHHFGRWILTPMVILLVVANTVNIGADIQAMAATVQLLTPSLDFSLIALSLTLFILLAMVALPYRSYSRFLKLASISLLSYVLVAFLAKVDWELALAGLLSPALSFQPAYLMTVVGILGTTISPYMFFWQANEEVEEERDHHLIRKDDPAVRHPSLLKLDRRLITGMYLDVNVGMFYSELIMFFIITATAATLYAGDGVTSLQNLNLAQLASVLRPLVGDTAFALFALGILGVGLLAIPVLAGSASYAIAELFGWQEGLSKKFGEARGFYLVIIAATLVGLALNFSGIAPVAALYYTAVLNGLVAVPLLILIWIMGNSRKVVGEHRSGWLSNILVVSTIVVMTGAAGAMLYFFGH